MVTFYDRTLHLNELTPIAQYYSYEKMIIMYTHYIGTLYLLMKTGLQLT